VERRESVESLKSLRSDTIVLQDFKHKAANFLKASLEHDKQFVEFSTLLGRTRSAIQQTELSHLTPPSPKQTTGASALQGRLYQFTRRLCRAARKGAPQTVKQAFSTVENWGQWLEFPAANNPPFMQAR
jgi:hypothetical protein